MTSRRSPVEILANSATRSGGFRYDAVRDDGTTHHGSREIRTMTARQDKMNRRQFTGSAAAAAVALSTGRWSWAAESSPFRLNYIVASCLYGQLRLAEILPEGAQGTDTTAEAINAMSIENLVSMARSDEGMRLYEMVFRSDDSAEPRSAVEMIAVEHGEDAADVAAVLIASGRMSPNDILDMPTAERAQMLSNTQVNPANFIVQQPGPGGTKQTLFLLHRLPFAHAVSLEFLQRLAERLVWGRNHRGRVCERGGGRSAIRTICNDRI